MTLTMRGAGLGVRHGPDVRRLFLWGQRIEALTSSHADRRAIQRPPRKPRKKRNWTFRAHAIHAKMMDLQKAKVKVET